MDDLDTMKYIIVFSITQQHQWYHDF